MMTMNIRNYTAGLCTIRGKIIRTEDCTVAFVFKVKQFEGLTSCDTESHCEKKIQLRE